MKSKPNQASGGAFSGREGIGLSLTNEYSPEALAMLDNIWAYVQEHGERDWEQMKKDGIASELETPFGTLRMIRHPLFKGSQVFE